MNRKIAAVAGAEIAIAAGTRGFVEVVGQVMDSG